MGLLREFMEPRNSTAFLGLRISFWSLWLFWEGREGKGKVTFTESVIVFLLTNWHKPKKNTIFYLVCYEIVILMWNIYKGVLHCKYTWRKLWFPHLPEQSPVPKGAQRSLCFPWVSAGVISHLQSWALKEKSGLCDCNLLWILFLMYLHVTFKII